MTNKLTISQLIPIRPDKSGLSGSRKTLKYNNKGIGTINDLVSLRDILFNKNSLLLIVSLLILSLFVPPVHSQEIILPEQDGALSDHFDLVDDKFKIMVEDLARELRRVTSVNLVVAIVGATDPLDVETYGKLLYDKWDVGRKEKGLDHGVLLLVSVLDRDVKIAVGSEIDFLISPQKKEEMEMALYPYLGKGQFSEGAFMGAGNIARFILEEWPKYDGRYKRLDMQSASLVLFVLTILAIFLTVVYGGTFLTVFATVAGGAFGWLALGLLGMAVGAAMGFVLNMRRVVKRESPAHRELREHYEKKKKALRKGEKKR
jgi:uncharacterized protein